MQSMKIGEVARRLNVSPTHLRELEAAGQIPAPRRTPTGFRQYSPADVPVISEAIERRRRPQGGGSA